MLYTTAFGRMLLINATALNAVLLCTPRILNCLPLGIKVYVYCVLWFPFTNVGKPCTALLWIDTLCCQQKKLDTKGDKGKSMMRALYVLSNYGMPKGRSPDKAMLNSEKIKPVALVIISYTCLMAGG